MHELPALKIAGLKARLPIIQGGMAVRISMAPLAAAVAEAGGIGLVAGSGMEPEEMEAETRKAREATRGIVGVNIMVATRRFKDLVHAAIAGGAQLVVAGAGFSRDLFGWCRSAGVACVPVVSSERVARLAERFGADAVVVEGTEAGGHLGTDEPLMDVLPRVVEAVRIPVIGAGGVVTGADIKRVLATGASGVQMGTRFAATKESSASEGQKAMYVAATPSDVCLMKSPVGLPGRAIRNPLIAEIESGKVERTETCRSCLRECSKDYCIISRLERAQEGDVEGGLVFAGSCVARIHDIPSVAELIERLKLEYDAATEEGAA